MILWSNSISIFRNLNNDVISGRGSDFFVRTRVTRSAIFIQFLTKIKIFNGILKYTCWSMFSMWEFFFGTGSSEFWKSKNGTFFLLNFTNLNVHFLESYRSSSSKLSKWQNQECQNIKKEKNFKKNITRMRSDNTRFWLFLFEFWGHLCSITFLFMDRFGWNWS